MIALFAFAPDAHTAESSGYYAVNTRRCWRVDVRRMGGVLVASGNGPTLTEATREAVKGARMAMRLERDERARLALSLAPKLTALSVKAGA